MWIINDNNPIDLYIPLYDKTGQTSSTLIFNLVGVSNTSDNVISSVTGYSTYHKINLNPNNYVVGQYNLIIKESGATITEIYSDRIDIMTSNYSATTYTPSVTKKQYKPL